MNSSHPLNSSELIVVVAAVFLLGALLYTVNAVLSPFVIVGALTFLLYPYRSLPLARRLLVLSGVLFSCWFLYSLLGLLVPFIVAFLIAYILNPLVTRLETRRIPRWLSSLTSVLVSICVVIGASLFVGPVAFEQFQSIIAGLAQITQSATEFFSTGQVYDVLARLGIPVKNARELVVTQISPRLETILKTLFEGIFGFVTGFSAVVLHIISAIIIPFLVFYILKDFPEIANRFTLFVPAQRREKFLDVAHKADEILGKYFRGAIVVAAIQGTLSGIVLSMIGVNYALILGIMTGILNFIPYVGLITSLVVASIVAVFSGEPVFAKILGVIALYLSQKLLEATVLGPKIIGKEVGLHPVLLILCLMVFGHFLGFVGLLIAVPATALLVAALHEWEEEREHSQPDEAEKEMG